MTELVQVNGHQIEIYASLWNGTETITYDGKVVSANRNLRVFSAVHSFSVEEVEERVTYEVQILSGIFAFGYAIRRQGIIQAHKP